MMRQGSGRGGSGRAWWALLAVCGCVPLLGTYGCGEEDADQDQDGWSEAEGDCDDRDPQSYPGAGELCDGRDNDCDGRVDEELPQSIWYEDVDGDGYGDDGQQTSACGRPAGYVAEGGDCDDGDATVYPGAEEQCDGRDQDCDGEVDEGVPTRSWYEDVDGDGYGSADGVVEACGQPAGYVGESGDCGEEDNTIHPGALEACDEVDNDCDGEVDEEPVWEWYPDGDGDGYGVSGAGVRGCEAPAGYVAWEGDCDDGDGSVYPEGEETCDGKDNDCDGTVEEDAGRWWYPDEDQDGYGREEGAVLGCEAPGGYVRARGDCDDADGAVYPGAADEAGDGEDRDCGGSDGAQPHVGLTGSSRGTIQEALDAAEEGAVIWVGPGRYLEHDLRFGGKAVTLSGTEQWQETVVDAQGAGRVFVFDSGEGAESVLSGFTITGGLAEGGAGLYLEHASPTLVDCDIRGNRAYVYSASEDASAYGGGLMLEESDAVVRRCRVRENSAEGYSVPYDGYAAGGGVWMSYSNPSFEDCAITDNFVRGTTETPADDEAGGAGAGGGVYGRYSDAHFFDCQISRNTASGSDYGYSGGVYLSTYTVSGTAFSFSGCRITYNSATTVGGVWFAVAAGEVDGCSISHNVASDGGGGGVAVRLTSPTFSNCEISENRAAYTAGISLDTADATLTNCLIRENISEFAAGGMSAFGSEPLLTNCIFSGNTGTAGGAMYLNSSSAQLTNCTLTVNRASIGGGIYLQEDDYDCATKGYCARPRFTNTILANNEGFNLFNDLEAPGDPNLSATDLYNPEGWSNHNLPALSPTTLSVEPGFLSYDAEGLPAELHLALSSGLVDAGDPSLSDPDGSRSDLGAYGGEEGVSWDLDADGYPNYFWPGTLSDAPAGFSPDDFDADDSDALSH